MRTTFKNIIVGLLLLVTFSFTTIILASCGEDEASTRILVEKDSYEIALSEGGEEENSVSFRANLEGISGKLYFSIKNDSIIKVVCTPVTASAYDLTITAISAGEASVVLFVGENANIKKQITVKVVQNISQLSLPDGYEYFVKKGEITALNLSSSLVIVPSTAQISQVKYSIVENLSNLDVSVSENGVIDATACQLNGTIKVMASANENTYVIFPVNIVEGVSPSDITLSYKFENERNTTSLYRAGIQYNDTIELIKTGSGGIATPYIDYYNEATIYFEGRSSFATYLVEYMIEGTSAQGTFASGVWVTLEQSAFTIQSVELGSSVLHIRINRKGAQDFFDYVTYDINVQTIDVPISLSMSDPTSDSGSMIAPSADGIVDYKATVFSNYAEGTYGQPFVVNVNPASANGERAKIVIDLTGAGDGLSIYNQYGSQLNARGREVEVDAGQLLYVKGTNYGYGSKFTVTIYSKFSQKFVAVGGERVQINVEFSVYEGITSFNIVGNTNEFYLNLNDEAEKSVTVELTTGSANAYSDMIYYVIDNDALLDITKLDNLHYTIRAKDNKEGETYVTFYSGNNYETTIRVHNYFPISSVAISVPSEIQNGYIGYREFNAYGNLTEVALQIGGQLEFTPIVNGGASASVARYSYALRSYQGSSVGVVSKNDNTRTLTARAEGKVELVVYAYGYNQFGEQTLSSGEVLSASVIVVCYTPIKTIELSSTSITLMDPSTVSYNKVSQFSSATLKANIYPRSASLAGLGYFMADGTRGDAEITWEASYSSSGEVCYISNQREYVIMPGDVKRVIINKDNSYYLDAVVDSNLITEYNGSTITFNGEIYNIQRENVGSYINLTALPIQNIDSEIETFTITAKIKLNKFGGREYSATCTVRVQKAVKVSALYVDNLAYSQINFDSRKGLNDASNVVALQTRVAPANAFDKTLQYDIVSDTTDPVFKVSSDGVVTPLRGGIGILRIAPQDSYKNATSPDESIARYITVIVQDGKTKQTAYSVQSMQDLMDIGKNAESLNSYYYLANDIELDDSFRTIGSMANPFTGYLSGCELRFSANTNGTITVTNGARHKLFNVEFSNQTADNSEHMYGIFARLYGGAVENVDVVLNGVNINASGFTSNFMFGVIAGMADGSDFTINGDEADILVMSKIINCSVTSASSINITACAQNNYIGGLVGYVHNSCVQNVDKFAVNLQSLNVTANSSASSSLYVGGLVGFASENVLYYTLTDGVDTVNFVISAYESNHDNGPLISGINSYAVTALGEAKVTYAVEGVTTGYDVYVNNFKITGATAGKSYVGGVVGALKVAGEKISYTKTVDELQGTEQSISNFLFALGKIACYTKINAENIDNVGGIVGQTELGVGEVYFDGTVKGANNVGGIAGYASSSIMQARVYTYDNYNVVQGTSNVGGLVGFYKGGDLTTSTRNIMYSSVSGSSSSSGATINGASNIGSFIGSASDVNIVLCYDNITSSSGNTLNASGSVAMSLCFTYGNVDVTDANLTLTNCYAVDSTNTAVYLIDNNNIYTDVNEFLNAQIDGNKIGEVYYILPSEIGAEYDGVNNNLPIIRYAENTYLYEVIPQNVSIVLAPSSRAVKVSDAQNGNVSGVLLFYYGLDSAFSQTLTTNLKNKINKQLALYNTYNLGELFALNLLPTPFSSYTVYIQAINPGNYRIASINQDNQLVLHSSGAFTLVFKSKQNPSVTASVKIYVVNYVSSYALYDRDDLTSSVYGEDKQIQFRKGTTFEAYAKARNTLEIEGIECELNSSDNFNLTASISTSNVQVSVTDVTVENDEEDPSKFKNEISAYYVDKSSTDVYNDITIIQTNSLTVDGTTVAPLIVENARFTQDLEFSHSRIASRNFTLTLDGVEFKASLQSATGTLIWDELNVPVGVSVIINYEYELVYEDDGITPVYEEDGITQVQRIVGVKSIFVTQGGVTKHYYPANTPNTQIKNAIFFELTITQEAGSAQVILGDYTIAQCTSYDVFASSVSALSVYAPNVTSGTMVIKPSINLSGEEFALNLTSIHPFVTTYSVFEGASSITCNITSATYAPTDSISFDVVLVSDVSDENIEFVNSFASLLDENGQEVPGQEEFTSRAITGGFEYSNSAFTFSVILRQKTTIGNNTMFVYSVSATLNDNYSSRYLIADKTYRLTFKANTLEEISTSVNITFVPQLIQRLDMLYYNDVNLTENLQFVLNSNSAPSSYISPSTSGMAVIDMYPSFAYFDILELSSSKINNVYIELSQLMQIDYEEYVISPYASQISSDGTTIKLIRINDITGEFSGKIYVRTYLSSNAEPGSIYTLTLNAKKLAEDGTYQTVISKQINLEVTSSPLARVVNKNGIYTASGENSQGVVATRDYVVSGDYFTFDVIVSHVDSLVEDSVDDNGEDKLLTVTYSTQTDINTNYALSICKYSRKAKTIQDGFVTYTYEVFVAPDLAEGTVINLSWRHSYYEDGKIHTLSEDRAVYVTRYLIDRINLSDPFGVHSNTTQLSLYNAYTIVISSVEVKSMLTNSIYLPYSTANGQNLFNMLTSYGGLYCDSANQVANSNATIALKYVYNKDKMIYEYRLGSDKGEVVNVVYDATNNTFNLVPLATSNWKCYAMVNGEPMELTYDSSNNYYYYYDGTRNVIVKDVYYKNDNYTHTEQVGSSSVEKENYYSFKIGNTAITTALKDHLNKLYFGKDTNLLKTAEYRNFLMLNSGAGGQFNTLTTTSEGVNLKISTEEGKAGVIFVPTNVSSDNILRMQYSYVVALQTDGEYRPFVYSYSRDYKIFVVSQTSTDLPQEVNSQELFEQMETGKNYILTSDITLIGYTPQSANFASLDGNGYTITIGSFSTEALEAASVRLGLFTTISSSTIVKNLTINIGYLSTINLVNATQVNIGFFALENTGVITNCDVIAVNNSSNSGLISTNTTINNVVIKEPNNSANKVITIKTTNSLSTAPVIALFVASNSSSISHSRVMDGSIASNTHQTNGAHLSLKADGQVSAFVGTNTGTIASCFATNVSISNYYSVVKDSKTSGFVITNSGTIIQSYVKNEFDGSATQSKYHSSVGCLQSNGVVSGFVFTNQGQIKDSYSNIALSSNANVAGFVYQNAASGTIENAYSACLVKTNSAVHMPFVGVSDLGVVQDASTQGLSNVYYLASENSSESYVVSADYPAIEISVSKYSKPESFGGFSFSFETSGDENSSTGGRDENVASSESVWEKTNLGPTLTSATTLAFSRREAYTDPESGVKSFRYDIPTGSDGGVLTRGVLGSETNPIVILSAQEFNNVFASYKSAGVASNLYIRIANDINFDDINGELITTSIGLRGCNIEGNGFTIKNIVLSSNNDTSGEVDTLGLFSYLYACNIRNLNLEIKQANCENVKLLGGLAGAIINSNISRISVTSSEVMSARFVAGGLAGAILGASTLNGISASVSININYKPSTTVQVPNAYTQSLISGEFVRNASGEYVKIAGIENITNISYAGTVAGIIDTMLVYNQGSRVEDSELTDEYIKRMTLGGENLRNITAGGKISLNAQYVGGITGFLGAYSHMSNASFELEYNDTEQKQYFEAEYCVGGLVGVNNGMLTRSSVKYNRLYESTVEEEIYTYLKSGVDVRHGKTNLFTGRITIAGGIVGINYFGTIEHCYSLADVVDSSKVDDGLTEQYLGGVIGWTYLGRIDTVYSIGNVQSDRPISAKYVGGIVGRYTIINASTGNILDEVAPKFVEVFALNLWNEKTIENLFASNKAGVVIGMTNTVGSYAGLSSDDKTAFYIDRYTDADDDYGKNLYTIGENNDHQTIHIAKAIGNCTDSDNWKDGYALNVTNQRGNNFPGGFSYLKLFTDEATSEVTTFYQKAFLAQSEIWQVEERKLPKVKFTTFTNEEEVGDVFSLLHAFQKYNYKSLIITKDIDFDMSKYRVIASGENAGKVEYDNAGTWEIIHGVKLNDDGTLDTTVAKSFDISHFISIGDVSGSYRDITNLDLKEFNKNLIFSGKLLAGNATEKDEFGNVIENAENQNVIVTRNIKNIYLGNASGLFTSTRKTTISNINFTFVARESGFANDIKVAGLITARDYASTFYDVNVSYIASNDSNQIATVKFYGDSFGAFAGVSTGATVLTNCSAKLGIIRVAKSNANDEGENKNIGALIGSASTLIVNGCRVDTNINVATNSQFDGKIGAFSTNVGAIAGYVQSAQIIGFSVGCLDNSNPLITLANGENPRDSNKIYVGGAVGKIETSGQFIGDTNRDVTISGDISVQNAVFANVGFVAGYAKSSTYTQIRIGAKNNANMLTVTATNGANVVAGSYSPNADLKVGGLCGLQDTERLAGTTFVMNCNIYVDIDVTLDKKLGLFTSNVPVGVGGAFGKISTTSSTAYLSKGNIVGGSINIKYKDAGNDAYGRATQTLNVGGFVGENVLNATTSTNPNKQTYSNSALYVDIIVSNGGTNSAKANVNAGGFVGATTMAGTSSRNYVGSMAISEAFIAGVVDVTDITAPNGYIGGVAGTLYNAVLSSVVIATSLYPGENAGESYYNATQNFDLGVVAGSYTETITIDTTTKYGGQDSVYEVILGAGYDDAIERARFGVFVIDELVGVNFNAKANKLNYTLRSYETFRSDYLTYSNSKDANPNLNDNTFFNLLDELDTKGLFTPSMVTNTLNADARYVCLNADLSTASGSFSVNNNTRVLVLNQNLQNKSLEARNVITISNNSAFTSLSNKIIVSNGVFEVASGNNDVSILTSDDCSAVVLGVYAYSTINYASTYSNSYTSGHALLVGGVFNGVMSDVMLDVNATIENSANFAFIANRAENAVVYNVQILGSLVVQNGANKGFYDDGASINILGNSAISSYINHFMFACNVVSDKNLAIQFNSSSILAENIYYDKFISNFSADNGKNTPTAFVGYSEYENANGKLNATFVDRWQTNYKALYKDSGLDRYNYGYEYLTRFACNNNNFTTCDVEQISRGDGIFEYKLRVNNYSRFMWAYEKTVKTGTATKYSIKLMQNINRNARNGSDNYYLENSIKFDQVIYGEGYGLYGIRLYEANKAGLFNGGLNKSVYEQSSYTLRDITFGFTDLCGTADNGATSGGFAGAIAPKMTNTKLLNVTVFSNHASYIYGLAVGGICGQAVRTLFDNVVINNVELVGKDSSSGIAGGMCAKASDGAEFINCKVFNCIIISGNGSNAGAVGGLCAKSNGIKVTTVTISNCQIVSGDATSSSSIANFDGSGATGGECYIGGVVGYVSGSFECSSVTYSSSFKTKSTVSGQKTSLSRLNNYDSNVCAGAGGGGATGYKGGDGDSGWMGSGLGQYDGHDGGPGGRGGSGGITWIGQVYGYNASYNYITNKGTTSEILCSAGGKGGTGGSGGDGKSSWFGGTNDGDGGDGGPGGNNGNGKTFEQSGGTINTTSNKPGAIGSDGVASEGCYLQSLATDY